MRTGQVLLYLVGLASLCIAAFSSPSADDRSAASSPSRGAVDFNRDVRPILSEHCFVCHGPSAKDVMASLRLDLEEDAKRDRGGYAVVVPGDSSKSQMWNRISAENEAVRMPPAYAKVEPLTADQIEILKRWIDDGAEYKMHWSYVSPDAPELPAVENEDWCRNDIDRFILAELESNGLEPEGEADRSTLIRRLALTLTGLPPTPEEVREFLADSRPTAYERLVERLLASPRYGEHQARYWLDAVRYGDTHGLHLDNERVIWPYRDWVVRAFNYDLPFDEMTIWQLAGDLLPAPTTEQLIATGYVRMNLSTNEGGAIEDEFLAKNVFDRLETTATVYMGATLTCARCHDHKFDPFSTKDYYSLYAFLNSTAENVFDGNLQSPEPTMKAPTPEEDAEIRKLRSQLEQHANDVNVERAANWLDGARVEPATFGAWQVSQAFEAESFDAAFAAEFGPEPGGVEDNAQWSPVTIEPGKPSAPLAKKANAAAFVRTTLTSPSQRSISLQVDSDDGIRVWANGQLVHENKVLRGITQKGETVTFLAAEGENEILFEVVNAGGPDGLFVVLGDILAERIEAVFQGIEASGMTSALRADLARLYLEAGPESAEAKDFRKLKTQVAELEAVLPLTLIAEELAEARPAFVLRRGEYDQPLEQVERGVPAFLGSLPVGVPKNRLGLAQWLVSGDHPLVGRVIVNRIWQQHFGTGLVDSPEDFGSRGAWPSHPELLDYLAVRFVEDGWRLKDMHRLIVTSASFRQAASASDTKRSMDPSNRLISRGPRFRLDAEIIRDQALYLGGLLIERLGGKGVNTYQPGGLWEAVGYTSSNTSNYVRGDGDALYRRSLYTFWKRTSPPATMSIFDAPARESCTVARSRTNTPMQALATMNDTQFVEAARKFAERVILESDDDRERARWMFISATSREPLSAEIEIVLDFLALQKLRYSRDTEAAEALAAVGEIPASDAIDRTELAAWTMACNLVLNLDEVLTQH